MNESKMPQLPYKVLCKNTVTELEQAVNDYLRQGYSLYGAPFPYRTADQPQFVALVQVLVLLPEPKPGEKAEQVDMVPTVEMAPAALIAETQTPKQNEPTVCVQQGDQQVGNP